MSVGLGKLTPFKVGVFSMACVVAFIFMYVKAKGGYDSKKGSYLVHAFFDDVSGIAPKSTVRMVGIPIGEIQAIELAKRKTISKLTGKEITQLFGKVTIKVQGDITLWEGTQDAQGKYQFGASVLKRSASLLGDFYIELSPGYQDMGRKLKDGDEIHEVITDTGFAAIAAQMEKIGENVNKITESLANVIGGKKGEAYLQEILKNSAELVEGLNGTMRDNREKIDRILSNAEGSTYNIKQLSGAFAGKADKISHQIEVILGDVQSAAASVKSFMGGINGEESSSVSELGKTLRKLQEAMDNLNGTLDHTRSIAKKIDEGQGTVGRLVNDDKLINNIENVTSSASEILGRIDRLRTIVSLRSEYNTVQNSLKNYFGVRLQPKPDKYYLIEFVDDPQGETRTSQTTTRSSDPSQPAVKREQESVTSEKIKLSFQMAKRFYFVTGRFGMIESTGGLGMDVNLFSDKLQLRTDIFEFGRDVNPRMKHFLTYEFFKHIYVLGGADDMLNDFGRDFFFGAGLRFDDEDLKALLASTPSVNAN